MSYSDGKPARRKAERDAYCRACPKRIKKGDEMIAMYSHRNRGQHIYFHLGCVLAMATLCKDEPKHNVQAVSDFFDEMERKYHYEEARIKTANHFGISPAEVDEAIVEVDSYNNGNG